MRTIIHFSPDSPTPAILVHAESEEENLLLELVRDSEEFELHLVTLEGNLPDEDFPNEDSYPDYEV